MLCIINPYNKKLFERELNDFFKLRKVVLIDQRGWTLSSYDGKEIDDYDHDQAHYLIYRAQQTGEVLGGVRLTPTLAPNLTLDKFSHLIDSPIGFTPSQEIWESSRLVTVRRQETTSKRILKDITLSLFIGMVEYGLYQNIHSLLMLTEIRLERIGRMVQWHLKRLGPVEVVGNTFAVVGLADVSEMTKKHIRDSGNFWKPVFWQQNHNSFKNLSP
ncbi:MAG: hypothetical protein FJX03_00840 [Alphaproteobacteria bacterium]|nr:hypothetical protein [Alphaproteobacteria bacterium]